MPALSKLYTKKQIDEIRQKLIGEHGNNCALCRKPREAFKKNLSVDHRHSDGLIRGLLCYYDNKFRVGRFELATILPAVEYLVKYELEGELCQKYGNMLLAMKEDIKSATKGILKVSQEQQKQKKAKDTTKVKK